VLHLFSIVLSHSPSPSPRNGVRGWRDASLRIAIFDAKPPGISCTSNVLNYADIISNCVGPHCKFRGENGLDQLGFNCA